MDDDDAPIAAPAARGLLTGWIAAKTVPWLIRLAVWGIRAVVATVYAAFVWRRARSALLAGALDDEPDPGFTAPPSVVARERGIGGWIRGPRAAAGP